MRLDYGIRLETSQKLIMTPQLRQAIAILQLSALELEEMVEQELLENPVLEEMEREDGEEPVNDSPASEITDRLADYFDWDEFFKEREEPDRPQVNENGVVTEFFSTHEATLHEHLEFQLQVAVMDGHTRGVGQYLIGCIDDNGYLCCSTAIAAEDLGEAEELVELVLQIIQSFDPVGVGARDLKECLALQVVHKKIDHPLVMPIIEHHLPDVAAGRFKAITDALHCSRQDIQQAMDIIRTLDPKPGRVYDRVADAGYILPDITVQKVNQEYVILINDHHIPRLTINPYYRKVVREEDDNAKRFIEQKLNSAVWLIKSIEQRRRTLYNVMEALIELQRDFFDLGPRHVRPLTMKKVADRLGIHESTVSRATAGKYVDTPNGLFSMRIFFSAGVQGTDGEDVSASRVKKELQDMVNGEDATKPLSDQVLVEKLAAKGIQVSRRTITKYREELKIPSSNKRKRY